MPRFRLSVFTATVACVALLSGCGSDGNGSEKAYRVAFAYLNLDILSTGQEVAKAVTTASTKTDAEVAVDFARISQTAGLIAGSLARLTPPKDLKADHVLLIRGMRREAGKLSLIVMAALKGDAAAAKAATIAVRQASSGIRRPRLRLVNKLNLGP